MAPDSLSNPFDFRALAKALVRARAEEVQQENLHITQMRQTLANTETDAVTLAAIALHHAAALFHHRRSEPWERLDPARQRAKLAEARDILDDMAVPGCIFCGGPLENELRQYCSTQCAINAERGGA